MLKLTVCLFKAEQILQVVICLGVSKEHGYRQPRLWGIDLRRIINARRRDLFHIDL